MKSEMKSYDVYNAKAVNGGNVWVMFLLLGWSYGSMNQMDVGYGHCIGCLHLVVPSGSTIKVLR